MKLMKMRGMRRQEIIDYFMAHYNLENNSSTFIGEQWRVEVSEESLDSLGSLKIPSTTVRFYGEKDILEPVIYKFRLRFLTAGG